MPQLSTHLGRRCATTISGRINNVTPCRRSTSCRSISHLPAASGPYLRSRSRACTVVSDAKCTSGQMAFRNELRVDGARLNDHNFGVHISAPTIQSLNASD